MSMPDHTTASAGTDESSPLARTIGPVQLICYGVGGMLGAGIYALVGTAAGEMGNAVWMAFIVSMVAALLTGLSYASLGSRYPKAGGAAYMAHRAYGKPLLTYVVCVAVIGSGLASMAAGSIAVGDQLQRIGAPVNVIALAIVYLCFVAVVVFIGIRESMWMNILFTTVEVLGLLLIIAISIPYWGDANLLQGPPDGDGGFRTITASMVLAGAVLTFFSFVGFEDILNVAEETKDPQRTIPIGLIGAMSIATLIYLLVAISAVSVLPDGQLKGPGLRGVAEKAAPWMSANLFSLITIFAVANTALLNYIMASRLLYGMARQGLMPAWLGKVNAKRKTPWASIVTVLGLIVVIVLIGKQIELLAPVTTLLLLSVFALVNVALIVLKLRPGEPRGGFEVPFAVPAIGAVVCLTLVAFRVHSTVTSGTGMTSLAIAGGIVGLAVVLYAVIRPKGRAIEAVG